MNADRIRASDLRDLEVHPLAELFPMARDEEILAIADDIRENGFDKGKPIILLGGKILDGRNRRAGTLEANKTFNGDGRTHLLDRYPAWVADFDETLDSPLDFVLRENLNRRHLNESQRALVAANIAAWERGMNQFSNGAENLPTQKKASEKLSISERALRSAKRVRARSAELVEAVQCGKLTVHSAEALVELGDRELAETLTRERRDIVSRARDIRNQNKRAQIGTQSATKADRGHDLYETPECATRALLALEEFGDCIWEPACGRGAIVRVLEGAGHNLIASDLVDYGTCLLDGDAQNVKDFLDFNGCAHDADVVTNPPYDRDVLNRFVAHAVRMLEAGEISKIAMLMNLNVLCGFGDPDREYFMETMPPARIHVFKRRLPMMHRDGWEGPQASSSMNTAWFVWEAGYTGPSVINRVDWKDHAGEVSQ